MKYAGWFCGLALACSVVGPVPAQAGEWPNWRGPHNNGICDETGLATEWSDTKNVAWKLPMPGPAGSTPVVAKDRIFLTSVDADGRLLVMAVGTDGKELWRKAVAQGNKDARGDEGNSASPSPVTDGDHVWAFFGQGTLACFTADGQEVWKFNTEDRYGKLNIQFGMTSSPLLDGEVLYLQLIHGEGDPKTREARIVALDKRTGKQIWAVERPSDGHSENEHSYASPVMYQDEKNKYLITHGSDYVVAHRLKDGSEIWRCGGLNLKEKYDPTLRFVASPVCAPGLIVVPSAKKGPVVAIKPGPSGDITGTDAVLWKWERTPDVPSPLILDDLVYLCMHDGNLNVLEAATGKEVYFERTHRQRHRASPVYADGHLYLTARDGKVTVVKAGRQFQIVAENEIPESLSASPAIANGTIYLRTFDNLYAIRKSGQ